MAKEYEYIKPAEGRTVYQPDGLGTRRQRPMPEVGMSVPIRPTHQPGMSQADFAKEADKARYYREAIRTGDAVVSSPPKTVTKPKADKEG